MISCHVFSDIFMVIYIYIYIYIKEWTNLTRTLKTCLDSGGGEESRVELVENRLSLRQLYSTPPPYLLIQIDHKY